MPLTREREQLQEENGDMLGDFGASADNTIVKQMARTAVIVFCTLTNHRERRNVIS
jgi:hypothetical protein